MLHPLMTTTVLLNAGTVTSRTSLWATCLRRPPEGSSLEAAVETKRSSVLFFSCTCELPSYGNRRWRGEGIWGGGGVGVIGMGRGGGTERIGEGEG